MNVGYVAFNVVTGGDTKKQLVIVLSTMAVILVLPFAAVISMGSRTLQFLASTPTAESAETQGFYMGGLVDNDTYEWGNCTYWAFAMRFWAGHPIPNTWGNANTWDDRAHADGYVIDHTPTLGAVYQTDAGDLGHVAYVTYVDTTNGDWTISEMNVKGLNIISSRTFGKSSAGYYNFIHDKEGATPWTPLPLLLPAVTGN